MKTLKLNLCFLFGWLSYQKVEVSTYMWIILTQQRVKTAQLQQHVFCSAAFIKNSELEGKNLTGANTKEA